MEEEVEYVYIVFRPLLCRINITDLSFGKPRPVEIMMYFRDFGLPVNMGGFCLNSKVYLIGGEEQRKGEVLDLENPFFDEDDNFENLSNRMIVFDPSKKQRCIGVGAAPPMRAPKTCARVSIIDGKAYVLSGAVYTNELPEPRFECYDPRLNSWEALPDPPFYKKLPFRYIYPHVIGRKIFVNVGLDPYYYDVDHKRRGWIRHASPPEPFPLNFDGRSAEFEDYSVFIAYFQDPDDCRCGGLVAYRNQFLKHKRSSGSGSGSRQLILQGELAGLLPAPSSGIQTAHVLYLGGGRFCLLLSIGGGYIYDWDLHVVIFGVEMLDDNDVGAAAGDFVDAVMLHHHTYEGPGHILDLDQIIDVFAMCEWSKNHGLDTRCERSKKHGLDSSGVDRSIKKQAKLDRTVKKGSPPSQYYQYPRSAQSEQASPHSQLKSKKGNHKGRSTNRENNTPLERDGHPFTRGAADDGVERPNIGRREARERKRREIYSADESSCKEMNEYMAKFDALVKQQLAQSEKEIKSKEEMHQKDQEMKERHFQQKDELLRLQAQKMRQKQWRAEKEILEKDLKLMAPEQAEMFGKIQQDIWVKWQRDGTLPL